MWTYSQSNGSIKNQQGEYIGAGYSGHGDGKNNPHMQQEHNVGPLPRGFYQVLEPFDHLHKGPYCMRLKPAPENEMFGRSGFMIHGDSKSAPGTASEGCLIAAAKIRHMIWDSDDHLLEVTI